MIRTARTVSQSACLGLLLMVLSAPGLSALAAETPPATVAPEGLGLLILLIGLAAIGIIGMTLIGRMMPARSGGTVLEDDDELIEDDAP